MRDIRAILASFVAIILLVSPLSVPKVRGDTSLEADRLEITSGKTLARGNVKFRSRGLVITGESLQLLNEEYRRNLSASGEVTLTAGRLKLEAKNLNGSIPEENKSNQLQLSLNSGSGTIGSINFKAEEITIIIVEENVSNLTLEGKAKLELSNQTGLAADRIELTGEPRWKVRATGTASYSGQDVQLKAAVLTGKMESGEQEETFELLGVDAVKPSGEVATGGRKNGSGGFSFTGEEGKFTFDEAGDLSEVELSEGSFTSCDYCSDEEKPAYSLKSRRASLFPGEFLVARSSKLESFGLPIWSTPNYFIPLKDFGVPKRSYFPRIGFSGSGGLNFQGAVPFYLNRSNFGNLRADFSTENRVIGAGLDYYSDGKEFNLIGQLYGNVKNGESNYLAADVELDYEWTNWLQLTGEVDYRRGRLQGQRHDRNEWSLSLIGTEESSLSAVLSRGETEEDDDSSDSSKRVVKKLPETSYFLEDFSGNNFSEAKLGGKLGYYREYEEYEGNRTKGRTGFRANLLGDFSIRKTPLKQLDLSLGGLGRFDGYVTGEKLGESTRLAFELTPELRIKEPGSLTIKFNHRARLGESPFVFDRIEELDRLSFNYSGTSNDLYGELDFHYDFLPPDGFSNLNYEIGFDSGPINQEIGFEYNLSQGLPEKITSSTVLARGQTSLGFKTGYDFSSESIVESELKLELAGEDNSGSFQLTGLQPGHLAKEFSTSLNISAFETWSFHLEGKYDFQGEQLSELSYSVNNTLQDCLRVGVSGTLEGVWFNAELAGF